MKNLSLFLSSLMVLGLFAVSTSFAGPFAGNGCTFCHTKSGPTENKHNGTPPGWARLASLSAAEFKKCIIEGGAGGPGMPARPDLADKSDEIHANVKEMVKGD